MPNRSGDPTPEPETSAPHRTTSKHPDQISEGKLSQQLPRDDSTPSADQVTHPTTQPIGRTDLPTIDHACRGTEPTGQQQQKTQTTRVQLPGPWEPIATSVEFDVAQTKEQMASPAQTVITTVSLPN
jgi:hypothetical protein